MNKPKVTTMNKHTPGKWTVVEVKQTDTTARHFLIDDSVNGIVGGGPHCQVEAFANLQASAPAIAKALRDIIRVFDTPTKDLDPKETPIANARSALRNAGLED